MKSKKSDMGHFEELKEFLKACNGELNVNESIFNASYIATKADQLLREQN